MEIGKYGVVVLLVSVVFAEEFSWPTGQHVVEYLRTLKVPDFQARMKHYPMEMAYSLENTMVGDLPDANKGSDVFYDLEDTFIRVRVWITDGWIRGYMKASITMVDDKSFNYTMEGDFKIHATNSNVTLQVLLPKIGSGKSSLVMTSCLAQYDAITMEFNATRIKDPKDQIAMNHWLSKALHETLSDLYCIAIRADLDKEEGSVAFRGLVGQLLTAALGLDG